MPGIYWRNRINGGPVSYVAVDRVSPGVQPMSFLTGLFIILLVGITGDIIVKLTKGAQGSKQVAKLQAELDELRLQLQDQAGALADAEATLEGQASQIEALHERLDFAERLLAQVKQRPALGGGSGPG